MFFKIKIAAVSFILSVVLFSSCSVEKRMYRKGYYVNWHHASDKHKDKQPLVNSTQNTSPNPATTKINTAEHNSNFSENSLASSDHQIVNKIIAPRKTIFAADDCGDLITMRNGEELKGKVIEVNEKQIKYKRCDNLDGPLITINKSDVFMIKYANGSKDVFKEEAPVKKENVVRPNSNSTSTTVHPFAKLSLTSGLLCILSFALIIIGTISAYGSGLTAFSLLLVILGIIGLPVSAIIAVVSAIIALVAINKQPEKFSGKGKAIGGLIIGALFVLLSLAFLKALGL